MGLPLVNAPMKGDIDMDRIRVPERAATAEHPTKEQIEQDAARRAEEIRLFPLYEDTERTPPKTTRETRYVVEWEGLSVRFPRDSAIPCARYLVKRGFTRYLVKRGFTRCARVFRETSTVTREELPGFQAIKARKAKPAVCAHGRCQSKATVGGRFCGKHAALRATAGKNGRPELQAVQP
jgi:hypothetical protein